MKTEEREEKQESLEAALQERSGATEKTGATEKREVTERRGVEREEEDATTENDV